MTPVEVPLVDNSFLLPLSFGQTTTQIVYYMRFQTSLLSLFLLALVLASYVDASAKKSKKKGKKVSILSDNTTGRGDVVSLLSSLVIKLKFRPKPTSLLVDTTNTAPAVQLKGQGILVQVFPKRAKSLKRMSRPRDLKS